MWSWHIMAGGSIFFRKGREKYEKKEISEPCAGICTDSCHACKLCACDNTGSGRKWKQ